MSFPKAKLHRFNEDTSCAPPPGTYDPKIDNKVKGTVLSISKRFPDQMCNSSSLDSLNKPTSGIVTFRTPQLRKIPLTPRLKYLQEKGFDSTSDSTCSSVHTDEKYSTCLTKNITRSDYQRLERELSAFADKLVGRDQEISKLKEELEEIKNKEKKLNILLETKSNLVSNRNKEITELKNNLDIFSDKIDKERKDNKMYIDELKDEIAHLKTKKEDLEEVINEKQRGLITINDQYLVLENELKTLRSENEQFQKDIVQLEETNSEMLTRFECEAKLKIEELDENIKVKVHSLEQEVNTSQQNIQVDFQTKLNFVSHQFDVKRQEMENKMETCFLNIKELERIVDEKEKKFSKDIQEVDERCRYMYRELCKVEQERDSLLHSDLENKLTLTVIQERCDFYENDLEQYKNKCKNYEITLNTMQLTVRALSDRLLESESEVERLTNVELDLEAQKKNLEEKSSILLSDITALRDSIDKMEKEIVCDVVAMKEDLAAKLEYFKVEASKQTSMLNEKLNEKQSAIDMLLNENYYYKKECERKEENTLHLQDKVRNLKQDIINIQNWHVKVEYDFHEKLTAQKNLYKILSDQLESANGIIEELQCLKASHENQISTLNDKIYNYELSANGFENEVKSLKTVNMEQMEEIVLLKSEIETNKETVERKNEEEVKQQHYIDSLIADLVLENERCESLEVEKIQLKVQVQELMSNYEALKRSLKNAEEKITVLDEAKSTVEVQLVEAESIATKQKQTIKEMETKIKGLQLSLNNAKEKIKTEIPNLEHEIVNKAGCILDLSMKIDSLKDIISESESKISSVEAEKNSLNLLLDEANRNVADLKTAIDNKNIHINNLTNQLNVAHANYQESLRQKDELNTALNSHSEMLRLNVENEIKLTEAERRVIDLQNELSQKEIELTKLRTREHLEAENKQLKEDIDKLNIRVQVVTEERDKIETDFTEIIGHQNIHQKIKHLSHMKQQIAEYREKSDTLEIENTILKKKLAEFKENAPCTIQAHHNHKQHNIKKVLSPAVLRERNQ